MKAYLKNYRQAPRKVRLLVNVLRGKKVARALEELSLMPQKAAQPLQKLVASAVANAKLVDSTLTEETLMIERITVDKGVTFVRYMPRAFGRASPIHRESSHIRVSLASAHDTESVVDAASVKKTVTTKKAAPAKRTRAKKA
jgi:large subunit ribosomal protein L22